MNKRVGTIVIILVIVFFVWEGIAYVHYRTVNAVSDAAFIKSDRLVMLAFKLPGKVVEMTKEPNESVRKGELLARLDPSDLNATKAELLHKRDALQKQIEEARLKRARLQQSLALRSAISADDIERLKKRIEATALRIDAANAKLAKLRRDETRFAALVKQRLIAPDTYEKAKTERIALERDIEAMQKGKEADTVALDKAKKALSLAKLEEKRIAEISRAIAAMEANLKSLGADIELIKLHLDETRIFAPFDGAVAKKFTDAPRVVDAGIPVYAVVDPDALYCEVLLSEKKLHGVKPGNAVRIEVDAIKDKTYRGTVSSIAPVSASTFSLVPRDIASGEFTKLDQRFIVRISLEEKEGLRSGMGATVAIERK